MSYKNNGRTQNLREGMIAPTRICNKDFARSCRLSYGTAYDGDSAFSNYMNVLLHALGGRGKKTLRFSMYEGSVTTVKLVRT